MRSQVITDGRNERDAVGICFTGGQKEMKNRISAITRWPLDDHKRREAAECDIQFFKIMREVIGERFISSATISRYRAACKVMCELQRTDEDGRHD